MKVGTKSMEGCWLMYLIQPHLRVGLEGSSIQRIGDLSSVLCLTNHVLEGRPGDGSVVQMFLQEKNARSKIAVVVLVRNTPTQRTKLSSFLYHRMHEAESEKQLTPLGWICVYTFQSILIHNDRIRFQNACFETCRWFIRDFGGHL